MIREVYIENFKGFEHLDVGRLAQITLVGGKNGVGKTALLEAIFLFLSCRNPDLFFQQMNFRGALSPTMESQTLWRPLFYKTDLHRTVSIEIVRNDKRESVLLKNAPHATERIRRASEFEQVEASNEPRLREAVELHYQRENHKLSYTYVTDGQSLRVDRPQDDVEHEQTAIFLSTRHILNLSNDAARRLSDFDMRKEKDMLVEALRFIEPRVEDLSVAVTGGQDTGTIYADIGLPNKMPVKLMGDGMSRLLSILLAMGAARDGILFIDEVENGIHHSVLSDFWMAIRKMADYFSCQVIATTHSYECMKSAFLSMDNKDDFCYLRLDRAEEASDKIDVHIFDAEMMEFALKSHVEIR